jgi:hypothetical protein
MRRRYRLVAAAAYSPVEEVTMTEQPAKERRPRMGERGWFPDHAAERRADFARTTPASRVQEAIRLSKVATRVAAASRSG